MPLSSAERQRRHRARLRERLAAADDSLHPDDFRALRDEWHAKQLELEAEIERLRRELEITQGHRQP